jgi:deoxyadenosine/deoxycytidine kinase
MTRKGNIIYHDRFLLKQKNILKLVIEDSPLKIYSKLKFMHKTIEYFKKNQNLCIILRNKIIMKKRD